MANWNWPNIYNFNTKTMEDIEGISEEEFNYLVENPGELKVFMRNSGNLQILTDKQLAQALTMLQAIG
jgi:hypothetical protein